mgnify:CR=1 FL=1
MDTKDLTTSGELNIDMSKVELSEDVLNSIYGKSNNQDELCNLTIEGYASRLVQARKHKKKRINKKWLKIYGYKEVFDIPTKLDVEGCKITQVNDLYISFELRGKYGSKGA